MSKARRAFWQILVVAVIGLWATQPRVIAGDLQTNDYTLHPTDWYDFFTSPATPGQNGLGPCRGMPQWGVTEPYCNLWVKDIPLGYQPARGPSVALQLSYKMRDDGVGNNASEFSFGKGWNCDWRSYVETLATITNVYLPGGGVVSAPLSAVEFHSYMVLTQPDASSFCLQQHDGSTLRYTNQFTINGTNRYYLTEIADPFGQKLTLVYATNSTVARLLCVIDADGRTNSLSYTTNVSSNTNLVVAVTDGYGRTANLGYNSSWQLTGISDVVSNGSSFAYDANGWMTNLTTPYGTTTFVAQQGTNWGNPTNGFYRWLHITDAGAGNHLWLFRSDLRDTLSTNDLYRSANSFYWGPRQYNLLPNTTNLQALSANDYTCARRKNWDRTTDVGAGCDPIGLMFEWEFSPDGVNAGQRTDYKYAGQSQPVEVSRDLHNGYSWFDNTIRNPLGGVTDETKPFSRDWDEAGFSYPQRLFGYSADYIDFTGVVDFDGHTATIGYTNHLPVAITNANREVTSFTYNDYGQRVSVSYPGGVLTTTNYYFTNGPWVGRLQSTVDYTNGMPVRQDGFTYTDDQVFTHTDVRGWTTTNYWDGLGRLTGQSDGLGATTNLYDKLDLVFTRDRMGYTNGFAFDAMRRMTNRFDAFGRQTYYEHCTCGLLESVTEAVGTPNQRTSSFTYDNAGRQIRVDLPGGLWVTNGLNLLGQITSTTDSSGRSESYAYNFQGLVYAVSNALGQLSYAEYDYNDRVTQATNANGVPYSHSYDPLGRPTSTSLGDWPANWSVYYSYTANIAGPTSFTDADSKTTFFGYDAFGRKIAETNANNEITSYTYELDGALKTLTDGNQHTRTWNYYPSGWLSNKVDGLSHEVQRYSYNANGWLTNMWTPEHTNTGYFYDSVGNRTSIVYPEQTVQFAFDELNRLTNMVDSVGTSAFKYSPEGLLQSEIAPWPNSAVTNGYSQGLRTALGIGTNWVQNYTFEAGWRMSSITSPAGLFRYNYGFQPASALVTGIRLPNAAFITNQFDSLARLTNTALVNFWGHTLDGYGYTLDNAGLRRSILRNSGLTNTLVAAGYDNIGQLTSWSAIEGDGFTSRAQEQLSWTYDAAHNLYQRVNGGLTQTFSVDAADQINSISRSGTFTHFGATPAPATNITVNGQGAARYGDFTFAASGLTLSDGTNSFTTVATNVYGISSTNILNVNYPVTVSMGWDRNGSLTNDGLRTFCFDSENRLTNVFVPGQWSMVVQYDGLNRMRVRRECDGAGNVLSETRYLYDGKLVVQERDSNSVPLVTYTRGLDKSGSMQGAGGIGGLLARTDHLQTNAALKTVFYQADGNGNVTALMDGQENIVGRYLYGPYGRLIGQWGTMASVNTVQFSSMLQYHGIVFYSRRAYLPELSRWATQDPIGEDGGVNLYGFVGNEPVGMIDPDGLAWYDYVFGFGAAAAQQHGDDAIKAMLAAKGYDSVEEYRIDHPYYGGTLSKGGTEAAQVGANLWSSSTEIYLQIGQQAAVGGIVAKAAPAAAQGIADAVGESWISRLWARIWRRGTGAGKACEEAAGTEMALVRVGEQLTTVEDVLRNPNLLDGKGPAEIQALIGKTPGWKVETLGQGTHAGQGWVLREYNAAGETTGRLIRWHPGGGRHGPEPYWRVSSGPGGKSGIIPGGPEP
jgi:RHS repeat-associated protein